jgi:regulator of protease activity HflC (stomatin/prohibitin superfamily)
MAAAVIAVLIALAVILLIIIGVSARVVRQFERGVVFRLGRVQRPPRAPGLVVIRPFVDRMEKVNMQIITLPVPGQEGITRDNVTVRVDAVVYFRVKDPVRALVDVQNYEFAISQVAQTSLRSIIGKSDLDDLLSNREKLNQGLELMIDSPAVGWGIEIDRVEIKDVALPETMKRSMSRQAEAERERRSRIITADGEYLASRKLASAGRAMATSPSALQLRLLQTIVEVAAEKNSTVVLPFPVELLRFLDESAARLTGEKRGNGGPDGNPERQAEIEQEDKEAAELAVGDEDAARELAERGTARGEPADEQRIREAQEAREAEESGGEPDENLGELEAGDIDMEDVRRARDRAERAARQARGR